MISVNREIEELVAPLGFVGSLKSRRILSATSEGVNKMLSSALSLRPLRLCGLHVPAGKFTAETQRTQRQRRDDSQSLKYLVFVECQEVRESVVT